MMKLKTIVVTGANRGIGNAICEGILRRHGPVKLYACSRAGADLGFKLDDNSSEVVYPKLDITNTSQIEDLVSKIKSSSSSDSDVDVEVDVLINNAGTNKYATDPKEADEIVNVNYHGTANMCRAFVPLMADRGRIVNVSSTASGINGYRKEIQDKFRDPNLTIADVDSLANGYLGAVASGSLAGWGDSKGYAFSKACVNAMTIVLARENPDLYINCCCPGWVATDMGRIMGEPSKSPMEGATIPLRLGLGNIDDVSGKYWANPSVSSTADGQVMAW